jgi:hypothetical protein
MLSERHRRISCYRTSASCGAWRPRCGQPLPPPQRHPPIAEPSGLSHSQNYLPPRFRADRAHHTYDLTHRVVATAAGWPIHRSQSQALRNADRDGIQRRRFDPALNCARASTASWPLLREPQRGSEEPVEAERERALPKDDSLFCHDRIDVWRNCMGNSGC